MAGVVVLMSLQLPLVAPRLGLGLSMAHLQTPSHVGGRVLQPLWLAVLPGSLHRGSRIMLSFLPFILCVCFFLPPPHETEPKIHTAASVYPFRQSQ